jgi:ABC-type phosphate transport system permease subunit
MKAAISSGLMIGSWAAAVVTGAMVVVLPFVLGSAFIGVHLPWWASLASTGLLLATTLVICLPLSLLLALILDQAAPRGVDTRLLDSALAALSGVPSVVHGVVALLLAGANPGLWIQALTLATLVGPGLVVGVRRSFQHSRPADRLAAQALGASALQVLVYVVGPAAAPALLSATFRAAARILGLAAPLLVLRNSTEPLAVTATRDSLDGLIGSGAAQSLILVLFVLLFHAVAALLVRPSEAT